MELANLKSYQRTIASVELPMKHFIETGFWNPHVVDGYDFDSDVGDTFVRRASRAVARELKRPFIQCYASYSTTETYDTGKKNSYGYPIHNTRPLPAPKFSFAYVEMPKRKYLTPLVAPLLLLPEERRPNGKKLVGYMQPSASLWRCRIESEEFWNDYYQFALNDPDCRKARRLSPLTA